MPLIKSDPIAVSREEFADIRARLDAPYKYHLLARDDLRILFLRTPRPEPDPVTDLEGLLERVPDNAVQDLHHLVLIGTHGNLHLPASIARGLLERRVALDKLAIQHLRLHLDAQYDVAFHRVSGDPSGFVRLGLRIPRARCLDLNEADLQSLARAVGPHIDDGSAKNAVIAYIVADEDHVRLPASECIDDLAPRWNEAKNIRLAPPPPPTTPEPRPVQRAPQPRRRPTRSQRVKPLVDLEFSADATPPEIDVDPELLRLAVANVEAQFETHGFALARNVAHDHATFVVAAERANGYPRRVLVRAFARFTKDDAATCLQHVRDLEADLLVALAPLIDEDAARRTLASKVKALTPREVTDLRL